MASDVRSFFDQHDDDGDGCIDADELTRVLADLGLKRPGESDREFSALVARAMREHDANADGTLSFNEFRSMYATITGVDVEDRREAASGSVLDARGLPSDTFTAGKPTRDGATGGITSPIEHDFTFTETLGTGGFAVVKKATHTRTKRLYAVKIVNVTSGGSVNAAADDDAMTIGEVAEEIRLTMSLSAASKSHAVKVYDFYVAYPKLGGTRAKKNDPTKVYVVMELLNGGDLLEAITSEGVFCERDAAMIMHRLFIGLQTMHAKNVTHRDLKLENLIFAERGRVVYDGRTASSAVDKKRVKLDSLRIADFGLAKKMKTARARLTSQCGTPAYIAPEVLNGETYTPAVDMWAAGVILYAALCGELPFDHRDQKSSFKLIVAGKYHAPNVRLSAECADLLNRLLCVNKVKRLTASEALQHPFLGSLRERNHRRLDDEDLRDAESPWTNDAKFAATENESSSHGLSRRRGDASDQNSVSDAPSLRSFHALLAKQESSPGARLARAADSRFGTDLETRRVLKGELLIREGDVAEEVFLIKKGRVAVEVRVDGKTVVVATRGEGEFVGEMGADVGAEAKKDIADEGDFGYNPNAKREAGERAEENGALIKNATFDARADAIKTSPTAWVSGASASAEKLLRRGATNDDTSDEQTNASSPGRRGADVRALEDVTVAVMNAAQMRWLLDHDYGADSELTSAVANRRKELERATRTVTFSERAPDVREYKPTPLVTASRQW